MERIFILCSPRMFLPILLLLSASLSSCANYRPYSPSGEWMRPDLDPFYRASQNDFSSIIPAGYNRLIHPQDVPVPVKISLNVTQILSVKEDEQSFSIHVHYSQEWIDPRIQLPAEIENYTDALGLDFTWRERIWIPDTYFYNAIGGAGIAILAAPYNFILYNNSRIRMVLRSVIKLKCDMNLRMFPHDTQVCDIILVSCKPLEPNSFVNILTTVNHDHHPTVTNDKRFVKLEWQNFQLESHIDFPKFSIQKVTSGDCTMERSPGYHCAKASITLRRRWGYYFIRIYGPSLLLVVTSFIGFWIPLMGYPARVAIVVTPLLSLITQQTQINSEINVNYVVSLHVWMMLCTFFVFICLIEMGFAVVYKHQVEERSEDEKSIGSPTPFKTVPSEISMEPLSFEKRRFSTEILKPEVNKWVKTVLNSIYGHIDWSKAPTDRNKVDYVARIVFPLSFAASISIYTLVVYKNIE